jgi:purine-binding chemotaxis protein CheW
MAHENVQGETEEEEFEQDQFLVFSVKSQEFGIQAIRVQEISGVLGITQVPNAPPYIEGILNLRGRLASVINFRKKFGLEVKENDEDTRIVMVELAGLPIGILVDSVEEVMKIQTEKVQGLPHESTSSLSEEYMTGVAMLDDRLVMLLDIDKILSRAERIDVNAAKRAIEEPLTVTTPETRESRKTDTV